MRMNSMQGVVGILLVVLTPKTHALTIAHEVEQPAAAGVVQADPPAHGVTLSAVQEAHANGVRPDDGLQQALSGIVLVSDDTTVPSPDELRSSTPSISKSREDGRIGCGCCDCDSPCPCFYGQVEALFLTRASGSASQPIIVDANTGATLLSTSDLDSNFDPGLRATVGMRICGGRALEFSYFGLFQGGASAVVVQPDPTAFLIFPNNFFGNAFIDMARAEVNYSSWLNSFEMNLPCCCGCCDHCCDECGCPVSRCRSHEWFAGFRYLSLSEELNITAQRVVAGAVEEGVYNDRTDNHLYGVQLGARIRRTQDRVGWEATGKAGLFGNDAQQEQSVTDFPNFPLRPTVSSSGSGVAFVGEANLSALYRLTDIWNLRAGYTVIWIEGVALAPDQLDFNFATSPSGDQFHNGGGILLHGVNFGAEARW